MERDYLTEFLDTKALEGRSESTLEQYRITISKMLAHMNHPSPHEISVKQLRDYLAWYKKERKVSNVTLDNIRRNFTSFFNWLHDEGIIQTNPAKTLNKIKTPKTTKMPYTEDELETLREKASSDIRTLAIIELLYASGMRVGELCSLTIGDINWEQKKAKVMGKGSKEREVYFNTHALRILKKYLDTRKSVGAGDPLLASKRGVETALKESTVETIMRELGKKCGVKCHCHRFRRTFATNMLNRGIPLEQVAKMLGHSKIETTLIYVNINEQDTRRNYEKFM